MIGNKNKKRISKPWACIRFFYKTPDTVVCISNTVQQFFLCGFPLEIRPSGDIVRLVAAECEQNMKEWFFGPVTDF